jgi:hypothetical protein
MSQPQSQPLNRSRCYRINDPNVVAEAFGDEIVTVNLDTGVYYSMTGTAASIWTLLNQGHAADDIEVAMTAAHEGDASSISSAVSAFITRLVEEKLIVAAEPGGHSTEAIAPPSERRAFMPPVIDVHSDMQDILLLDPVHDVDQAGWPLAADMEQTPHAA